MQNFHDVRFPDRLAFGTRGGPIRRTTILPLANGAELRNAAQSLSRRRYDVIASLKSKEHIIEIMNFFEARFGQLYSFRFRDPVDHAAISDDGIQDETVTVNALKGEVIFPVPPPTGAQITASFEFDLPVRFDTDRLDISLEDFDVLQLREMPLIEVFDHG